MKEYTCSWCGKTILRYPCQVKGRAMLFCCRQCQADYRSKAHNPEGRPITRHEHLSEYNRQHNAERMTPEVKEKLRASRLGTGEGKTYTKRHGRHEHRIVAEQILGRPLKPGEVVHHIDRNKRNNDSSNLMIFKNQAAHAAWHKTHDREEVVPHEVHTP